MPHVVQLPSDVHMQTCDSEMPNTLCPTEVLKFSIFLPLKKMNFFGVVTEGVVLSVYKVVPLCFSVIHHYVSPLQFTYELQMVIEGPGHFTLCL